MRTAHDIVADFIRSHAIDIEEFDTWLEDGRYRQDEANIHDTRYLELLGQFVEERDEQADSNAASTP